MERGVRRWCWFGSGRPGDGGASSSLELGPAMAGGFLGARRGVERGRMAKASLGFGRGSNPLLFDAHRTAAADSPYSLYAGEPRGARRFAPWARSRIAGPTCHRLRETAPLILCFLPLSNSHF